MAQQYANGQMLPFNKSIFDVVVIANSAVSNTVDNVSVIGTANVSVTGTSNVSVTGTANVSVIGTANVSVTGTANVSVLGLTKTIVVPLTVNTSVYVLNNNLGGLVTISNAARVANGSGIVQSIVITSASNNQPSLDIILFNRFPSNTTFTDHANTTFANNDLSTIAGVVHITDWTNIGNTNIGQSQQITIPFVCANNVSSIYATVFVRAAPTFVANTDVNMMIQVLQD